MLHRVRLVAPHLPMSSSGFCCGLSPPPSTRVRRHTPGSATAGPDSSGSTALRLTPLADSSSSSSL
jgi:hypothetical protein